MQNSDLKKKVLFTLLVLVIYRFGTFVPVPGVDVNVISKFFTSDTAKMFGMINLFSGGALERMSIFALNIMPYITASIIMQLLTSMHKGLESLKKEGEYGRSRINQYTRYLTITLSLFQSVGVYYALSSNGHNVFVSDSKIFMWTTCVSLVGGTVMLMWFGERITTFGIGNGISMIIFVGIISSIPSTFAQFMELSRSGFYSWWFVIIFFLSFVGFVYFIALVERTHKRIKIQHPNASRAKISGHSDSSFLPLKVNISGVIPPIFASSILMFPIAISQFIGGGAFLSLFSRGSVIYFLTFSALILFFSFFYSSIIFNTEEVANNLKKSNCFISGIRPGSGTSSFLDVLISKLTFIGAVYLVIICVIPEILITNHSIPLHVGGTGILIIVNVVLDLVSQVQSHNLSSKYKGIGNRKRIRVR